MTLLHYDTPLPSSASPALRPAHSIVRALGGLLHRAADARRRYSEQRALDALPLDLRKDLGWPAGDIRRS
jgi:hypothetical protein